MRGLVHRAIEAHDCAALIALHNRCFTAWEIETSIFASPRIDHYLRQVASLPHASREQFLWGAWRGERLVGYAFGRALPNSWHLNYLAVDSEEREHGVGTSLWDAWLEEGRRRGLTEYSLDMWQSNEVARPWYERKGCRIASQSWVLRRALQPSTLQPSALQPSALQPIESSNGHSSAGDFQIINWENAAAWQQLYGFSNFDIARGPKRWAVSRLGEELFRVSEVVPVEVETLLHQLDSKRALLLMLSAPHHPDAKVSLRLVKSA